MIETLDLKVLGLPNPWELIIVVIRPFNQIVCVESSKILVQKEQNKTINGERNVFTN
jgi:hypothetical protein